MSPYDPLQEILLTLLLKSGGPLKAARIAAILSSEIDIPVNKKFVNPALYALERKGLVVRDALFRWSVLARPRGDKTKPPRPTKLTVHSSGSMQESPNWTPNRPPPSAQIGHWVFTLDQKRGRELWRFKCTLCGFLTQHRVRSRGFVLPLTGKLRDRRRRHDRSTHPNAFQNQAQAEYRLLGVDRKVRKPRNPGAIKSLMDALGDI